MYVSVGNEINALVIPSGLAFEEAYRQRPDIKLHQDHDGKVSEEDAAFLQKVAESMRSMESVYPLTPTSSGVSVEYAGRVEPGFELFGRIEQYAVRENVARQFQALADEIERVAVATGGASAPESRPPAAGAK